MIHCTSKGLFGKVQLALEFMPSGQHADTTVPKHLLGQTAGDRIDNALGAFTSRQHISHYYVIAFLEQHVMASGR